MLSDLVHYLEHTYLGLFRSQKSLALGTTLPFSKVNTFGVVENAIASEILGNIPDIKGLIENKRRDTRVE